MLIAPKPIALFFHADNNAVSRAFHCPWCLKRLFDTNGQLVMVSDNSGPTNEFYTEVKCRNSQCQAVWRIFGPPAEKKFEPVITINGKPISTLVEA